MNPDLYRRIQVRRPLSPSEAIELLQAGATEQPTRRSLSLPRAIEPVYRFPQAQDAGGLRARFRDLRGDIQTQYQRFLVSAAVLVRLVPDPYEPRLTRLTKRSYEMSLEFAPVKRYQGLNSELDRALGDILSQPCRHIKVYVLDRQRVSVRLILEPAREVDSPRQVLEMWMDRDLQVRPWSKKPATVVGSRIL